MSSQNKKTGVYRSTDSLKKFKIRLKLEKCSSNYYSTSAATANEDESELQEFSFLGSQQKSELIILEDRIFKWQEKIFNENEIEKYSNKELCATPLEKKYNQCLQNLENELSRGKVLFTYVDKEEPIINDIVLTSPARCSTYLDENVTELRNRKCANISKNKTSLMVDKKNMIKKSRSLLQQKLNHCSLTALQTMHIAALIKEQNSDLTVNSHEVILVTISVAANGVITITPDFNYGNKPYQLQFGSSKTFYYYTVDHASKEPNLIDKEPQANLKLYHSKIEQPNYKFKMANPELFRLHILGEIVSAQHFENDGLSINFLLDLPDPWAAEENVQLFHVTQTCKIKCISNKEVAHFCYPFEFEVYCPVDHLTKQNTGNLPKWPSICLQVISRDSWQRLRTEGYGYMNIPFAPGSYSPEIKTWRPMVPSLNSQLRRLFIGGSPELTDLSQAGIPSITDSCHLSRFMMRSQSSGLIHVRLHTVQQYRKSSIEMDKYYISAETGTKELSVLQKDVADVIEAFHRARQRMLKARENVQL